MREIKFRAADTDNKGNFKRWVHGTPEFGDMGQLYMHEGIGSKKLCQRSTLGQYTGLHDKNGKEIYEGDLLEWDNFDDDYKMGAIEVDVVHTVEWGELLGTWQLPRPTTTFKVIGNIYENPDLITQGS
jgi:hypothetical protein